MKANSFKSIWYVLSVLLIPLIFFIGKQNEKKMEEGRQREDREYTPIDNSPREFKGMIISTKMSAYWKGTQVVHLSNDKFTTSSSTRNYEYGGGEMASFMHVGDSIYKPANTDSIYIYRGNKTYYFRLGMDINKK